MIVYNLSRLNCIRSHTTRQRKVTMIYLQPSSGTSHDGFLPRGDKTLWRLVPSLKTLRRPPAPNTKALRRKVTNPQNPAVTTVKTERAYDPSKPGGDGSPVLKPGVMGHQRSKPGCQKLSFSPNQVTYLESHTQTFLQVQKCACCRNRNRTESPDSYDNIRARSSKPLADLLSCARQSQEKLLS